MSEDELARDDVSQVQVAERVDAGWKAFWNRRGVTASLACRDNRGVPTWYKRAYHEEDQLGVYSHMLEPQELIERAISRKTILDKAPFGANPNAMD